MVYVLAVVAALVVGTGTVIEQRAARQAPPEYNLSPRLLVWLVQRPLWLSGVACSLLGNLLFAAALGVGTVVLVQAVFTLRLLFALIVAAAWGRHRMALRDMAGAGAVASGLVVFLLAAQPRPATDSAVAEFAWLIGGGSVVAIALGLVAAARRFGPARKAVVLGTGAGGLFGLQSTLMHTAVGLITAAGVLAAFTTWVGYAVVAVALLGMLLVQSAYEVAPLPASYPAIVTTELLAGIALGIALLGGQIAVRPAALAAGAAGIVGMVVGIYLLTTSPLVTGQLDRLVRQQEIGRARNLQARLDRELGRAERAVRRADNRLHGATFGGAPTRRLQRELHVIESGLAELARLQDDIARHRAAERQRRAESGHAELVEQDRELADRERRIDESARWLAEQARRLGTRVPGHAEVRR